MHASRMQLTTNWLPVLQTSNVYLCAPGSHLYGYSRQALVLQSSIRKAPFAVLSVKNGTAAHPVSSTLRHLKKDSKFVLTKQDTNEFVTMLSPLERKALANALKDIDHTQEDEKDAENAPTMQQLRLIALYHGLPFIGFGFLDNALMIVAGDFIDTKIGATLCISTMAAAALGNTVSDVAGIGASGYVEQLANRLMKTPRLTPRQLLRPSVVWSCNLGRVIGIVIGCLLGMIPLLFRSPTKNEHRQQQKQQQQPPPAQPQEIVVTIPSQSSSTRPDTPTDKVS